MPVQLPLPQVQDILPVGGVRIGVAEAGIRKKDRKDLTLIELAPGSRVAGVFTQNRFCAAPVQVCKQHLDLVETEVETEVETSVKATLGTVGKDSEGGEPKVANGIRALVINTGVANAGTGEAGLAHARQSCAAVARTLGISDSAVLPFSTGVILEPLPVERLIAGLPAAQANLRADGWFDAAHAIMTTDTQPKVASRQVTLTGGQRITLTGMSKGAGMIRPNMATMLGFVATDAAVAPALLDTWVREAADRSFNSISVDGDTSTNDSFILIATGAAGNPEIDDPDSEDARVLREAMIELSIWLAQAIVRDGEGATKFMTLQIEGGRDRAECRKVGYAIGHSPLVKTAFFASDPNLGRILAAIGYAGIDDLDVAGLRVWLGAQGEEILVAEQGGRAASYREEDGARIMAAAEITTRVDLGRGSAQATLWTCDFSYDYVRINADYRS